MKTDVNNNYNKVENLSIREFRPGDMNDVTGLTNELGYPTTVTQMTTRMETISQLDNYWTFVAVHEHTIIGYLGLNKNYFWEQDGYFIRIQALVVKKEYRRHGIGRELIVFTEKFAKELGAKLIVLNCGNRDERNAAHFFYTGMGFEPKSTGYIKKPGQN